MQAALATKAVRQLAAKTSTPLSSRRLAARQRVAPCRAGDEVPTPYICAPLAVHSDCLQSPCLPYNHCAYMCLYVANVCECDNACGSSLISVVCFVVPGPFMLLLQQHQPAQSTSQSTSKSESKRFGMVVIDSDAPIQGDEVKQDIWDGEAFEVGTTTVAGPTWLLQLLPNF